MADSRASSTTPTRRRDVHRRFSSTTVLFSGAAFVLGAVLSPVAGQAVERWFPALFQQADDALGISPLYVKERSWPWMPCSSQAAAVMPGGPAADKYLASDQGLNPSILTESGISVPWERASLEVLLSATRPDDTLLIESITPKVYKHEEVPADWTVSTPAVTCGGLDQRAFDLNLGDGRGNLVDKGILKGPGEGPVPAEVPTESLGDAFTVAQDDAAKITIYVSAKDGYYEFGLELAYSLNGQPRTKMLGTPEDPYKLAGGPADTSYLVDGSYKPI